MPIFKIDRYAIKLIQTLRIGRNAQWVVRRQVKPDDHSEVVPLLPIPNRTVKRLSADDSADSRVKVGHCQANIKENAPTNYGRGIFLSAFNSRVIGLDPRATFSCAIPA